MYECVVYVSKNICKLKQFRTSDFIKRTHRFFKVDYADMKISYLDFKSWKKMAQLQCI